MIVEPCRPPFSEQARHLEKPAARDPDIERVLIGDSMTHGWKDAGRAVWARYIGDIWAWSNTGGNGERVSVEASSR